MTIAVLNWIGWKFDIYQLKSVVKNLSTMKANTALAFFACGLWIFVKLRGKATILGRLLAMVPLLIGGLTLMQYALGISIGIDEFFFTDSTTQFPRPPGRMGTNTATNFLLIGSALLFLSGSSKRSIITGQLLLFPVFLIGFIALLGYAYSLEKTHGLVSFTSMAIHTTACFLVLVPTLCLLTPRAGLVRLLGRTAQSRLLSRLFLPPLLVAPLLLSYVRSRAERAAMFAPEIGIALMVAISTAISFVVALIAIRLTNQQLQLTRRTYWANRKRDAIRRERENAEIEEKARAEFLAMVSHDIRTPLSGILGLTDLLQETRLDEKQRDWVRSLRGSGQVLMTLVNDFLDFSKIEAGRFTLTLEPFELESTIADLASLYYGMAEPKKIALTVPQGGQAKWLMGDAVRIRQIVGNLLSNAIKFTDKGGVSLRYELRSDKENPLLVVNVVDSGSGISDEARATLFQAYAPTNAGRSGGSGLGLAISRSLARAMGGEVELIRSDKNGTEFRFSAKLPFADPPKIADSPKEAGTTNNLSVLVAEDNEVNQTVIQGYLKKLGISPVFANDGQQALQMMEATQYDLIFMDVHMPVLGGIETTKILRTKPFGQKTVIIALTANAFSEDIRKCKEAGMNDFLTKPVRLTELETMLKKWS